MLAEAGLQMKGSEQTTWFRPTEAEWILEASGGATERSCWISSQESGRSRGSSTPLTILPQNTGTFSGTWCCNCTGSHQNFSGPKTPEQVLPLGDYRNLPRPKLKKFHSCCTRIYCWNRFSLFSIILATIVNKYNQLQTYLRFGRVIYNLKYIKIYPFVLYQYVIPFGSLAKNG